MGFERFGGPDVLGIVQLPAPVPGPGQVRVQVQAATVNPADARFRSGAVSLGPDATPPFVTGLEFAGLVDTCGPGVNLAPGRPVAGLTSFVTHGRGCHAELVVVDKECVSPLPAATDVHMMAAVPMNGLTARRVLDILALPKGATIVVSGAAGVVGGYVTELASAEGTRVVAIASDGDEDFLMTAGAELLVSRGRGVAERVRECVPGGVDAAVDAALLGDELMPAVRSAGRFVSLRPDALPRPDRGIVPDHVSVRDYLHRSDLLQDLVARAADGRLTPRVSAVLPVEEVVEAHRLLDQGGHRGRIVLTFDHQPKTGGP